MCVIVLFRFYATSLLFCLFPTVTYISLIILVVEQRVILGGSSLSANDMKLTIKAKAWPCLLTYNGQNNCKN